MSSRSRQVWPQETEQGDELEGEEESQSRTWAPQKELWMGSQWNVLSREMTSTELCVHGICLATLVENRLNRTIVIIWARNDRELDQSGCSRGGMKELNYGYILKSVPTGYPNGLGLKCMRESQDDCQGFHLNT